MNNLKSSFWILATLLVCSTLSRAQHNPYDTYKEKFPDDAAIYVERAEVLTIDIVHDSLKAFSNELEDILYLKDQAEGYAGKRVYGSHFSQIQDIKAKTLVWDKNRYKEMVVSDFKKNNDRNAGTFYDDSYYYSFNFPSVASNNRTQLKYQTNLKDIRFMSGFVFASYLPQVKTIYSIKANKNVLLFYEVLNDQGNKINFKKTEKGDWITYEWSCENMPASKFESESPAGRYYLPHVVCYVKSFQTKKGIKNVATSANDLYSWYGTFVKDLNKEASPELLSVIDTLKSQSKNEMDLVKNVFYWVQTNIQYIAFEDGMRGLIPHDGAYVCSKRYGDCKDMANLIVNMLSLANVKAYRTWIGTRDLPYRYTITPTPLVDNHMIATYISKEGKYYFLDGTSDHTPFDFPSSMIQGKEALIGISTDSFQIKEVPVVKKERNLMVDSVSLELSNGELKGKGLSLLSGYPKVFGAYELDRSEKDDTKRAVTKIIGKGSNKFYLDNYDIKNLNNRDAPTMIAYTFRIGDYYQKIGDELYINLNLNKEFYNDVINTSTRKTPIESEYEYAKEDVSDFILPAGYEVEYMPPNATAHAETLGFEIKYEKLPGKIRCIKKVYKNYLLLNTRQFDEWNKTVHVLSEAYRESVILKKKN